MTPSFRAGYSAYNWIDQPGVLIEADSEDLQAPARNVATYEAGVPWRAINLSLSDGEATLTALFGAGLEEPAPTPREVQCLGALCPERVDDAGDIDYQPSLAAEDGARWRLYSEWEPEEPEHTLFDSDEDLQAPALWGADPTLGVHGLLLAEPVAGVVRVDFTIRLADTPEPPFDIATIGRLWAGPFKTFRVNWRKNTNDWGWPKDELNHRVRRWTAEFGWVRDDEMPEIRKVAQQLSDDRQIFWWPRADDGSQAMFCRFRDTGSFRLRYNNATLWVPSLQEDWLGV